MSASMPDLSQIPAARPPPGVIPNLVNPENLRGVTIAVTTLMLLLVIVFSTGRAINVYLDRRIGLDDVCYGLAVIVVTSFTGLVLQQSYSFQHQWDTPASWYTAKRAKYSFATSMLLGPGTFFAKMSILLLYLKLFSGTKKRFNLMIYATMIFCTMLYWVNVPLEIGFCAPFHNQGWGNPALLQQCARTLPFGIVQGTINIVFDFWLLSIPLPIIWRLNLQKKKKLWIAGVFMTGILGCTASVIGLVYRVKVQYSIDVSWNLNILYLAIVFEIDSAIICSAMPSFASMTRQLVHTKTFTSRGSSRSTPRNQPRSYHAKPSVPYDGVYLELGENARPLVGVVSHVKGGSDLESGSDNRTVPRDTMPTTGIMKSTDVDVTSSPR